jgi:TRAP-type transport system periplasmic protein
MHPITRRSMLAVSAASAALLAAPAVFAPKAWAQAKPKLRCAAVFSEQDIRAEAFRMFGKEIGSQFDFEPFFGGTLFKQGTELVAMQRGNLEMANLAPQDISKQIPAWSLLTAAFLFRDADHMKKTFDSPVGAEF